MGNNIPQNTTIEDIQIEKCGVSDVPNAIIGEEGDILEVKKYVKGLEEFIKKCPTPMSISLQGDWGSGKTTFLKTIEQDLKYNDMIKVVYFNTWTYSQFNDLDGLFFSLVSSIINQLPVEETGMKDSADKMLEKVFTVSRLFIKTYIGKKISDFTGVDSNELKKILSEEVEDRSKAIQCLKDEFAYLIKCIVEFGNNSDKSEYTQDECSEGDKKSFKIIQTKKCFSLYNKVLRTFKKTVKNKVEKKDKTSNAHWEQGKARVVICIDDLDRLEPKRAVEVLEVLKLFMDVEYCVYILAIDHNVVVDGVKSKYGGEMTEDKCNLFFDKIIQLPFKMPTKAYKFDRLLDDSFEKDFLNGYREIIYKFINDRLGNNPRTIKRFINRCYLLSKILESDDIKINEEYYCCILMIITVQISNEKVYNIMLNNAKTKEILKDLLENPESMARAMAMELGIEDSDQDTLNYLSEIYNNIKKIYEKNPSSSVELITFFSKVLEPSRSTSISSFDEENLFYISVGNEQNKEAQHSKSMLQLVNALLRDIDASKITELVKNNKNLGSWMKFDGKKGDSYFRSILETSVKNIDGNNLYIGVSTNASTKSTQINNLIKALKDNNYIDKDIIISWIKYEDDETINLLNL